MHLTLNLEEQPFVLSVKNEEGLPVTIDAAPEIGGQQKGLRPMELLASSLAGCMAIDVLNILRKQRVTVSAFSVTIDAARREGVPSPFERIDLQFAADKGVPPEKLSHAVKLSREKYCSVSASLHPDIIVTTTVNQIS